METGDVTGSSVVSSRLGELDGTGVLGLPETPISKGNLDWEGPTQNLPNHFLGLSPLPTGGEHTFLGDISLSAL